MILGEIQTELWSESVLFHCYIRYSTLESSVSMLLVDILLIFSKTFLWKAYFKKSESWSARQYQIHCLSLDWSLQQYNTPLSLSIAVAYWFSLEVSRVHGISSLNQTVFSIFSTLCPCLSPGGDGHTKKVIRGCLQRQAKTSARVSFARVSIGTVQCSIQSQIYLHNSGASMKDSCWWTPVSHVDDTSFRCFPCCVQHV